MNPYKVLCVSSGSKYKDIKKSFRELAKKYHPDMPGGDAKKFRELLDAWQYFEDLGEEVIDRDVREFTHATTFKVKLKNN